MGTVTAYWENNKDAEPTMSTYEELKKRIESRRAGNVRYETLQSWLSAYPDLRVGKDRWQDEFYYSRHVNERAEYCDIRSSCGRSDDSPLLVKPYLLVGTIRVYSDPYEIRIGRNHPGGGGYVPDKDWRERMESYGISQTVIDKVDAILQKYPPNLFEQS
jgi:hypothetical protein